MHDLGSILHYDDEDSPYPLEETKILNPQWVTRGVYKVLNNNALMQARGVLEFKRDPEQVVEYEHLLRLERRGIREFLPQGAEKEYLVRELLNDIEDPQVRNFDEGLLERIEVSRQWASKPAAPEVFLSYGWSGESEKAVEEIEKALQATGIRTLRDKKDLRFKGSIQGFMERIGRCKAVVLVVVSHNLS